MKNNYHDVMMATTKLHLLNAVRDAIDRDFRLLTEEQRKEASIFSAFLYGFDNYKNNLNNA